MTPNSRNEEALVDACRGSAKKVVDHHAAREQLRRGTLS